MSRPQSSRVPFWPRLLLILLVTHFTVADSQAIQIVILLLF